MTYLIKFDFMTVFHTSSKINFNQIKNVSTHKEILLNRLEFSANNGRMLKGHQDGSEKTGTPCAHAVSSYTWTRLEQWRGNAEASEKENTLKASMGVKGAERRMTWVMETRGDRRSNTGGSPKPPQHEWLSHTLAPLSSESGTHTQLDPHTYTHAWLILMPPPTRAHNACRANVLPPIQTHNCLPMHAGCAWVRKLHTSGFAELLGNNHNRRAIFGGKTDEYGVTWCDTRLLQVSRGVKQAGRAQTSLLLALRLQLHGWCPQGPGS